MHITDRSPQKIQGLFSLGPNQILNWYFKGALLDISKPFYHMESDGLNAVLYITNASKDLDAYTLKIENIGTSE